MIKILLIKKCIEIQIQLYWSKTWTGSFSFPTSISLTEVSVEEKEIKYSVSELKALTIISPTLLDLVHQVAAVDELHHKVQPVLKY